MTHAIAMLLVLACLQDKVDPAKHPWAKFKEGSWVRLQTTTKMAGMEMPRQEARRAVKSVTAEAVTVTTEDGGGVRDEVIPLVAKAGTPKPAVVEKGKEDVTIDGTKFACKILESTVKTEAGEAKTTTWACDAAPGGVVKFEAKSSVYTSASKLVKLKETVTIGDKDVVCWVTETTIEMKGTTTQSKHWQSTDMPGFFVRMTTTRTDEFESTQEVVEFEVK